MSKVLEEIRGSWEEIRSHDAELVGRQVRLQIMEPGSELESGRVRRSTAVALLEVALGWEGDDFEECLDSAYRTRQPAIA